MMDDLISMELGAVGIILSTPAMRHFLLLKAALATLLVISWKIETVLFLFFFFFFYFDFWPLSKEELVSVSHQHATLPVHFSRARRSWFFPSVEVKEKQDGLNDSNSIPSHIHVEPLMRVCDPLTIDKSLQALHQGFDRVGQVPRILLDIFLDYATAPNGPVFCLAKLCSHENPGMCESAAAVLTVAQRHTRPHTHK